MKNSDAIVARLLSFDACLYTVCVHSDRYVMMHGHYDGLGEKDGFVSYAEIKRALGLTSEDEWKKEIEPHDDGDQLLNAAGIPEKHHSNYGLTNCR